MKKSNTLLCNYGAITGVVAAIVAFLWWNHAKHHSDAAHGSAGASRPLPKPSFAAFSQLEMNSLRSEVLESLGYTKNQTMGARIAVTKSLPDDLSDDDLQALLRFLVETRSASVSEGDHAYFFHELCNKLHHFPQVRATYASALYDVAGNAKHDLVTRDYAIQHLRRVWEKSSDIPDLRNSIQASFWEIAGGDATTSASAMLSLHNLGIATGPRADYANAPVPTKEFEGFIDTVFSNSPSATNISQRMTAARIAGDRQMAHCSDHLFTLVKDPSEHMLVRVSAINSLGKLGKKKELSLLSSQLDNDPRLATAISHATR